MIARCTCDHAAQDHLHGAGRRVFNEMKTEGGKRRWRCTVCNAIRTKEYD